MSASDGPGSYLSSFVNLQNYPLSWANNFIFRQWLEMVRTRASDVPDHGGAAPPVTRGQGRAPVRGRGRGHPRVAPVTLPVNPVEDPVIEEHGEYISQARGGAQTPTAQALGHATIVYQTPGALPVGEAQLVATAIPEPIQAVAGDPHRLLDRWTRIQPLVFGGERHEDLQDIIDRRRDILHNMRILESHGVDFTTFQLEGRARRWWKSYLLGILASSPPMTWDQFTRLFLDMYIPSSQKKKLRFPFEQLQQGQMSVTDYEARFSEFSRHALMILSTDAERVRRFVAGLHSASQATMAREVEMGTSYELVVEIARRIEGAHQHGREQSRRDKRFQHSREFSGALDGGRGQIVRGQSSRPTYPAPPPPQGAPVRPYFSAMSESSYRPPAIQGSSGGYSGHQGQASSQQSAVPRSFYECWDPGHMKRDASVPFDPSYVSSLFAHFLGLSREFLGTPVYVSTPVGDSIIVDQIYRSYIVTFCGYETRVDLLLLDMTDFEVILGMD
ncbi:uncharacterized protein [Nicotiana tomentosiformis]|uniref:uncharacterized protein n=1 Tax=Nicotiana tomentosiformis TaxID=4098 RepID=UPI00388C7E76